MVDKDEDKTVNEDDADEDDADEDDDDYEDDDYEDEHDNNEVDLGHLSEVEPSSEVEAYSGTDEEDDGDDEVDERSSQKEIIFINFGL